MTDILHCIAKNEGDYWSARCLDFTLYAVGDTHEEAKSKLAEQINEYIYDALEGEDKDFAAQLLLRKAPLQDWLQYYVIYFLQRCLMLPVRLGEVFNTAIPHGPYHHA
jgi:hypothetical protein